MFLIQNTPKYIIELTRAKETRSLFWGGKLDGWQTDETQAKQYSKKDLNRQIWFFKNVVFRDSNQVYVKAKPVKANYNIVLYHGWIYDIKMTNGRTIKDVRFLYRTFPVKKCCQSKCATEGGSDIYIIYQFVHDATTGACLGEVESITEKKDEKYETKQPTAISRPVDVANRTNRTPRRRKGSNTGRYSRNIQRSQGRRIRTKVYSGND